MAVPQESVPSNLAQDAAERRWLTALRTGDGRAFESIFRAYAAPLCDFALSYVRERETAEEIVQDLFCRIWEQRFTVEMPYGLRPWLFSAVRNRSLNALRDRRVEVSIHEHLSRDARARAAVEATDAELSARDVSEAADRAVSAMPPRCREVYTLIRQQQLSYAETARILGISPNTVEVHMTRALAILRTALAPWLRP